MSPPPPPSTKHLSPWRCIGLDVCVIFGPSGRSWTTERMFWMWCTSICWIVFMKITVSVTKWATGTLFSLGPRWKQTHDNGYLFWSSVNTTSVLVAECLNWGNFMWLIIGIFNDACFILTALFIQCRMTNWRECGRVRSWPVLRYYPNFSAERQRKIMRKLCQDSRSGRATSVAGTSHVWSGVLITIPLRSVATLTVAGLTVDSY